MNRDVEQRGTLKGLIWFYVLSYALSWLIWSPLLLFPRRSEQLEILVLIGAFGPLLAAGIAAGIEGGWHGCARWLQAAFKFRIRAGWYLLGGLGLPLLVYCIPLTFIANWLTLKAKGSAIPAMLLHAGTNGYGALFVMAPVSVGSLSIGFTGLKTVVYGLIALVLVAATRGRLGVGARQQRDPGTSAQALTARGATVES